MNIPLGTQVRTHERCPESGVWKAVGHPLTSLHFQKGDRFPPYKGFEVFWQLRRYA